MSQKQLEHTITIDFETYYDTDYSLTKLSTVEYCQHDKFEIIGCGLQLDDNPPIWIPDVWQPAGAEKFPVLWESPFPRDWPWDNALVIAHNAMFDAYILENCIGITPKKYFCTSMGSRPAFATKLGTTRLADVAEFLGMKKGDEVVKAKGKHLKDFSEQELADYGEYCKNDVRLSYILYHLSLAWFKKHNTELEELELIDQTVKQFTRPQLYLHYSKLRQELNKIIVKKEELLAATGVSKEELMSAIKFAELLSDAGVTEIPTKRSPSNPTRRIPAFSKVDPDFLALRKHSGKVANLVEARLAFKSTQEETRLERLTNIAGCAINSELNVPLLYYGAHTGRFSGLDKINLQNLGRGSVLRECIVAPMGYKIVAADLAQIEARLTACMAGQWDLVEQFARGEDVYAAFASEHYGFPVNEIDHPKERFVGKTGILSLGYQASAAKFFTTMNNVFNVEISQQDAESVVYTYRRKYSRIRNLWYLLDEMIPHMAYGTTHVLGPVEFAKNKVVLPNGMPMYYRDLKKTGEWMYFNGRSRVNLYGGKLLENIIQALARIVMTTAQLRLAKHGLMPAMSIHDELVYCVKDENVDLVSLVIKQTMEAKVKWMPELPVKCKIGVGKNYGECK